MPAAPDRLQIAFLLLLNVTAVTVFIIYGHITADPKSGHQRLSREPFPQRFARWQRLLQLFSTHCRPNLTVVPIPTSTTRPLLFIKIHRSASSTVANLLLRHARAKRWPVCLPVQDDAHVAWPKLPTAVDIYVPRGGCRLLAHHAIFRAPLLPSLFTASPFTFTIIREPLQQLNSALFHFAEVDQLRLPFRDRLKAFLDAGANAELVFPGGGRWQLGRNALARSLGLDRSPDDEASLLARADSTFDLVGLRENLTASLVLLRRSAGLPFSSLIFTDLSRGMAPGASPNMDALRQRHRSLSPLDYLLYRHFAERLKRKIDAQLPREDFERECECVTLMNRLVRTFCSHADPIDVLILPQTRWAGPFLFQEEHCYDLFQLPQDVSAALRADQMDNLGHAWFFARRWGLQALRWLF